MAVRSWLRGGVSEGALIEDLVELGRGRKEDVVSERVSVCTFFPEYAIVSEYISSTEHVSSVCLFCLGFVCLRTFLFFFCLGKCC